MFFIDSLTQVLYLLSIVIYYSQNIEMDVPTVLPYLLGSVFTLLLSFFILLQFYYYKKRHVEQIGSNLDSKVH